MMEEIDIINAIREFGTFKQVREQSRNGPEYWTMKIYISDRLIYNISQFSEHLKNTEPLDNEKFKERCIKGLQDALIANPSLKLKMEQIIEPLAKFDIL